MARSHRRKTHKGLTKRVRVSATGKVKRKASFGRHLMSGKSGKRRRRVRKNILMKKTQAARTRVALGR